MPTPQNAPWFRSREAEDAALLGPGERQAGMREQLLRGEIARVTAFENRSSDVGSQIGQPQHSGEIGARQALGLRNLRKVFAAALGQLAAEVVGPGDQLDQLRVGFGSVPR